MLLPQIEQSLDQYHSVFKRFTKKYKLPRELFLQSDHVAVKCANELDYIETCHALGESLNDDGLWEVEMDGRKLAVGGLLGGIGVGGYRFDWVEIMEPRPTKLLPFGFVEHTEFVSPDLFATERTLMQHGVSGERQENPGHAWVNVVMDQIGREIKFNDLAAQSVIAKEMVTGQGRWLKP